MSGIVQVQFLGGFGNQLFQYCAARKHAELVGAVLETSDWVGRSLFGLTEPRWSCNLPETPEDVCGMSQTNVRLTGYFQTQRWVSLLSRAELKSWLRFEDKYLKLCPTLSRAYTAAHVRQGDYINNPMYANIATDSYIRTAGKYGFMIDIWVRQNESKHNPALSDGLQFLPDFLTLMRATILLRANSTFSWWAGVLGDGQVYSPVVEGNKGPYDAEFVLGNWPKLCDHVGSRNDDLYLVGW